MNSSWIELVIERASAMPMPMRDHDLNDHEQAGHDDQDVQDQLTQRKSTENDVLRESQPPIQLADA